MIRYLLHNEIDFVKYNKCIDESSNSRIYAFSWYLDVVCDDWDVLVKNDYEMVMPLPKRKKYSINYVYQVPWVQQLGVFSKYIIDKSIIYQFIKSIPKKYKLVDVFINSDNEFSSKYLSIRNNYILPLNLDLEAIKINYNKNRKRISKTDFSNFLIDKKGSINKFLDLYKRQNTNYKSHKDTFIRLQKLLDIKNSYTNVWNVYKNGKMIAGLFWLKDKHRITYLAPVATSEAKKENVPTYIVNELIKEHESTNYILDFEGSMVKGVANFYKSYGAVKEEYYHFKRRFLI